MLINITRKIVKSTLFAGIAVFLTACESDTAVDVDLSTQDSREITVSQTPDTSQGSAPPIVATGPASITDLVLITGQSNALGSQTTYDAELDQPVEGFYAYTDQGWQQASLRQVWDLGWHPAKGLGDDPHNNFGFHFGKQVVANSTRTVGIVLVTAPGEGINHWDTDNYFFNKIRNKALAALNELPHKTSFDGILWHQGETDWAVRGSLDPELSEWELDDNYYSNKLWQLVDNFRNESWFDHGKPFICGETAQSPINDRLMALNRNSDPWTACVEGEGLDTWDEAAVHFTAESLRVLGANYAERYLSMTGQ